MHSKAEFVRLTGSAYPYLPIKLPRRRNSAGIFSKMASKMPLTVTSKGTLSRLGS